MVVIFVGGLGIDGPHVPVDTCIGMPHGHRDHRLIEVVDPLILAAKPGLLIPVIQPSALHNDSVKENPLSTPGITRQ